VYVLYFSKKTNRKVWSLLSLRKYVYIKFLKVEYFLAKTALVIRGIGANIILMLRIIFITIFVIFSEWA
jgi:hypothetical protein